METAKLVLRLIVGVLILLGSGHLGDTASKLIDEKEIWLARLFVTLAICGFIGAFAVVFL